MTAKWVAYCHVRRITTETVPERIEGGVVDTAGLEASRTTPKEVDPFIAKRPAFGNVHGKYGPQVDFER